MWKRFNKVPDSFYLILWDLNIADLNISFLIRIQGSKRRYKSYGTFEHTGINSSCQSQRLTVHFVCSKQNRCHRETQINKIWNSPHFGRSTESLRNNSILYNFYYLCCSQIPPFVSRKIRSTTPARCRQIKFLKCTRLVSTVDKGLDRIERSIDSWSRTAEARDPEVSYSAINKPLARGPATIETALLVEGVRAREPQSRARHVPGITNYAPRTVIISRSPVRRCIDTVNIRHGKHRHHSPCTDLWIKFA